MGRVVSSPKVESHLEAAEVGGLFHSYKRRLIEPTLFDPMSEHGCCPANGES